MKIVNVEEAEVALHQLIVDAASGEDVVISRDGTPVARLVPIEPTKRFNRQPGAWRSEPGWETFVFDPTIFAPMTDEELAAEGWPV